MLVDRRSRVSQTAGILIDVLGGVARRSPGRFLLAHRQIIWSTQSSKVDHRLTGSSRIDHVRFTRPKTTRPTTESAIASHRQTRCATAPELAGTMPDAGLWADYLRRVGACTLPRTLRQRIWNASTTRFSRMHFGRAIRCKVPILRDDHLLGSRHARPMLGGAALQRGRVYVGRNRYGVSSGKLLFLDWWPCQPSRLVFVGARYQRAHSARRLDHPVVDPFEPLILLKRKRIEAGCKSAV
jgi:hypothetical protein